MKQPILFLDNDDTLSSMGNPVPGAKQFLEKYSQKMDCVVVTTSQRARAMALQELDPYVKSYYSGDVIQKRYYKRADGKLGIISDDYHSPPGLNDDKDTLFEIIASIDSELTLLDSCDPEKYPEIEKLELAKTEAKRAFTERWGEGVFGDHLIHETTKQPFDPNSIYVKPFSEQGSFYNKDLYLVQRLFAQESGNDGNAVMIGNPNDIGAAISSPSVPLIEVHALGEGANWTTGNRIEVLLSTLFNESTPAAIFDEVFQGGTKSLNIEPSEFASFLEEGAPITTEEIVTANIANVIFRLRRNLDKTKGGLFRVIEEHHIL